jgi:hypothetical protein
VAEARCGFPQYPRDRQGTCGIVALFILNGRVPVCGRHVAPTLRESVQGGPVVVTAAEATS